MLVLLVVKAEKRERKRPDMSIGRSRVTIKCHSVYKRRIAIKSVTELNN